MAWYKFSNQQPSGSAEVLNFIITGEDHWLFAQSKKTKGKIIFTNDLVKFINITAYYTTNAPWQVR